MEELTKSAIKDNKFYFGQLDLNIMVKRAIKHYRYHNNNTDPEVVVIPIIEEVDGIRVEYEEASDAGEVSAES